MALRKVLTDGHPTLRKVCRPYTDFNSRLAELLDDMRETLIDEDGVGLAAPQVGVARRCCVVLETNVEEGQDAYFIELVNPEIIFAEGEQEGGEGCLSFPGEYGIVKRPEHVIVRALDRYGKEFTVEGYGLTARAYCHEIDHLNGILYVDIAERMLSDDELDDLYSVKEDE